MRISPPAAKSGQSSPRPWLAVSLLTALAACLRVAAIDRGLWWDEIYFLVVTVRRPLAEIVAVFPGDTQHPLYSILARLSVLAFGEHPWSVRLPALLFGIATIPIFFVLADAITTRAESLLACAFLAVSYHHIWFSQNARGYSMLAFFTVLSTYLLLQGIRTGSRRVWLAYAVTVSLGVYTHLTMLFLAASHISICSVLALSDWRAGFGLKRWKMPLGALIVSGGLTLLFYSPILLQVRNYFHRPSSMVAVSTPRWAFWETIRGLSLGFGTQGILLCAALITALGAWGYLKQSGLLFALFALPGFITAAGAVAARGTMYPRFYFFLIGFAVLILVRGVTVLAQWIAARWGDWVRPSPGLAARLAAVFGAALLVASGLSLVRNYRYPKQDFEGAIRFVDAAKADGDTVVTVGAATYPLRQYYVKPYEPVETVERLRTICRSASAVWVVYTFPRYLQAAYPEVEAVIRKEFTVVHVFPGTVGDGDVYVVRFGGRNPSLRG
jgi:uncharacterized membrane protein